MKIFDWLCFGLFIGTQPLAAIFLFKLIYMANKEAKNEKKIPNL